MWVYDYTTLRPLRESRGQTRREVCATDQLNMTQHTLMAWERGKKAPRADYLALLATVYGVKPVEFFKERP